jgi:hypothetical protein
MSNMTLHFKFICHFKNITIIIVKLSISLCFHPSFYFVKWIVILGIHGQKIYYWPNFNNIWVEININLPVGENEIATFACFWGNISYYIYFESLQKKLKI